MCYVLFCASMFLKSICGSCYISCDSCHFLWSSVFSSLHLSDQRWAASVFSGEPEDPSQSAAYEWQHDHKSAVPAQQLGSKQHLKNEDCPPGTAYFLAGLHSGREESSFSSVPVWQCYHRHRSGGTIERADSLRGTEAVIELWESNLDPFRTNPLFPDSLTGHGSPESMFMPVEFAP